ncbi:MAG: purine-nucleoside phosphorylase [Oscillospiraceae bacterium]|nr:purine-nucleoside phosphorylase [Oscillospiraceae bacterium]
MYKKLENALRYVRSITDFIPRVALVLGSGLGSFAEGDDVVCKIDYADIPDFPTSSVEGHAGRFVFRYVGDVPTVIMQGRVHYYEGYSMQEVVMPIRLMRLMGAEKLFLTNAAGGINPKFSEGALMMIEDHISSLVPSPLVGKNIDELGVRFPDMSCVYDKDLRKLISESAESLGIPLACGVYIQTSGPNYETPAEIMTYEKWGADAVGMSTACEAMAARHMGMRVCGISCISNMAAGKNTAPLTHEDIKAMANKVGADFCRLVGLAVSKM